MMDRLMSLPRRSSVMRVLQQRAAKCPMVVMERKAESDSESVRSLISRSDLQTVDDFWTVD